MLRSTDHVLTTHTGSLPRPGELIEPLLLRNNGALQNGGKLDRAVRSAVEAAVSRQTELGIDIVNDGEMGRASYFVYVKERLTGFEGENSARQILQEERDFPEFAARLMEGQFRDYGEFKRPACNGPVGWKDFGAVERDIATLKAALRGTTHREAFMTSASPGTIADFLTNQYYASEEEYLGVLADTMRREYEAIVGAGVILQIDCPDLAFRAWLEPSVTAHRTKMMRNLEALNEATKNIPADRMRMHVCWGNLAGPHHLDVPFREIVDVVLRARPAGLAIEGANPRHEHEWKVWKDVNLPSDKVLIAGVIDTTTNFVEHPEVVSQRIGRYASVVGRENVIAGTDCGFGTHVAFPVVDARIAWAKLQSLVEGARLASQELW